MTDLVTYVWASYGVDGPKYCYEVGPGQEIKGIDSGIISMGRSGEHRFAEAISELSRRYAGRPVELIWEVPPDKKDIVSVTSHTKSFEVNREISPQEKAKITRELNRVLRGK